MDSVEVPASSLTVVICVQVKVEDEASPKKKKGKKNAEEDTRWKW